MIPAEIELIVDFGVAFDTNVHITLKDNNESLFIGILLPILTPSKTTISQHLPQRLKR
jgi:hypothetical protein